MFSESLINISIRTFCEIKINCGHIQLVLSRSGLYPTKPVCNLISNEEQIIPNELRGVGKIALFRKTKMACGTYNNRNYSTEYKWNATFFVIYSLEIFFDRAKFDFQTRVL